jgi:hypothetical protein
VKSNNYEFLLCMKVAVFCDLVPCSLVDIDRRFIGAYCLHHQGDTALCYKQETDIFILAVKASNLIKQFAQFSLYSPFLRSSRIYLFENCRCLVMHIVAKKNFAESNNKLYRHAITEKKKLDKSQTNLYSHEVYVVDL